MTVFLIAAFSRILFFIAVYAVHTAVYGYEGSIFQLSAVWNPPFSQGNSALNIANTWYAAPEFPASSYLPLFPLYPLLVSGVHLLTGNRFLAGMLLSFLFFLFSAAALYRLVLIDQGHAGAFRAVRYLCILPPTFLLGLPAPDSLLLLLSILTLTCIRKRKYYLTSIIGAAAACTSLSGFLLFVPAFFELMRDFRNDRVFSVKAGPLAKEYVPKCIALLLIPAGTLFCIQLIERNSGTAFPFFTVASELPNTGLTTVFTNFSSQIVTWMRLSGSDSAHALTGYVIPNILSMIAVPLVLLLSVRRIRLSYTLYGIVFFLFSFEYGNLASAPRYAVACVPFLIGLASCLKNKLLDFVFSILSLVLLAQYLYAFTLQWGVF